MRFIYQYRFVTAVAAAGILIATVYHAVRPASFERFLSRQPRSELLALWMGKKSVLNTVFPDKKAATLLQTNAPSILFLK